MGKIGILSTNNLLCRKFAIVYRKIATSCPPPPNVCNLQRRWTKVVCSSKRCLFTQRITGTNSTIIASPALKHVASYIWHSRWKAP